MIDFNKISAEACWSLFLDRDGVINERLPGIYISDIRDFRFIPGVQEALAKSAGFFKYIFVVTNQQGIGKKLMNPQELEMVHSYMLDEIRRTGGRIDSIYHCTAVDADNHPDRKPNTGMGLKAKRDYPDVDFSRSVMAGDSVSDILFGQRLGMKTAFLDPSGNCPEWDVLPDLCCRNLAEFASYLTKIS